MFLVIFSHASAYRFLDSTSVLSHYLARFAASLSEIGVQIFFVISGYIITSLLLHEETRESRVSIGAFYVRRSFRILPPFLGYLGGVLLVRWLGWISIPTDALGNALLFTCNTGVTDCPWWVAHTWSLAVEEQYYLAWPILFSVLGKRWRSTFLLALIAVLLTAYVMRPHEWHSNFIAFACIGSGAFFACSARAGSFVKTNTSWPAWMCVVGMLVLGPLNAPLFRALQFLMPVLIVYLIFAGRELGGVRKVLESRPLQIIGHASYSLYLWQQLFLGAPHLYAGQPLPLLSLAVAVALSVMLIERPSIRIGRKLSKRLGPQTPPIVTAGA